MNRKCQEEYQRKKKRRREIKDGKSKETQQRQKGDQRKNRAGKSTVKERDVPLVPIRAKLVFRCNVDKTKLNKKWSKKIKIHMMREGTRGRRIQIDMKRSKYIK